MPVTVSQLAIAPVKGMRLHGTGEIRLGQHGVTGDRDFLVIGEDGKPLLTSRTPALLQIEFAWTGRERSLRCASRTALSSRTPPGPGLRWPPGCISGGSTVQPPEPRGTASTVPGSACDDARVRIDPEYGKQSHIRQLEALGYHPFDPA
jgi:hypothetical protein